MNKSLKEQEQHVKSLLNDGSDPEIKKFSRKLMQNYTNEKNVFKGKGNQDIFKDYGDYSVYKDGYAVEENRGLDEFENRKWSG